MIIEDYKRINGWLNVRVNPQGNQSLYDFSKYVDGTNHTLSEAEELYNQYLNSQPERSKREDVSCFVYRSEKYEGPLAIDCKPSKECDEYHKNSVIQINLRCGALNSMET